MTDPLFVADLDTLKLKVRLAGLPASNQEANCILDQCILDARIKFYQDLGTDRVAELLAITYNPNPTTDDEITRALANSLEIRLVRCCLSRALPHAFMDASGNLCARWNEEAPIRENPESKQEDYMEHCLRMIDEDMRALDTSPDNDGTLQVFDGTPDCPAPKVGTSLQPYNRSRRQND